MSLKFRCVECSGQYEFIDYIFWWDAGKKWPCNYPEQTNIDIGKEVRESTMLEF